MNAENEMSTADGLGAARMCTAVTHDELDCSHLPESQQCENCKPDRPLVELVEWGKDGAK